MFNKLIWNDVRVATLQMNLNKTLKFDEANSIKTKAKSWQTKFLVVYQTKDITQNMHALCLHVPEFLALDGNIEYFTQQGMEKYNDIAFKNFFRSTNHRDVSAVKQLFIKRNRVQFLEAAGCARVKRTDTCSNCNCTGHTIETCTAAM